MAVHVSEPPRKPDAEEFCGLSKPAITRLPTPTVALIIVPGANAKPANRTTWSGVSKVFVDAVHRFSSEAVISPSSVLLHAIKEEVNSEPAVLALVRNAPAAIAGQSLFPHSRKLASANPLGGHKGLALG